MVYGSSAVILGIEY